MTNGRTSQEMNHLTPPKGNMNKHQKKKNAGKQVGVKPDVSDPDISIDMLNSNNAEWEKRFEEVELSFQNKIDALMSVMESKDKLISSLSEKVGKLSTEIGYLKESYNFLSKETSDMKTKCTLEAANTHKKVEKHQDELKEVRDKTIDLEDRSRRDNLVFYGIEETNGEDCEQVVIENILIKSGMFKKEEVDNSVNIFERVHRLGPKKREQQRPRPIIAKLGSFKDKEKILQRSYKLKDSPFGISEDFSKPTLQIRSELVSKAKLVRDQHDFIKSFRLKHTRLILKYENPDNGNVFYRGFSISDIHTNPNWYLPNMTR